MNRRNFLEQVSTFAGAGALAGVGLPGIAAAKIAPVWKQQIGLELYTVRSLLTPENYEPTIAKLAAMGYKEVEPADPYNHMAPAQYKALLDKYGLKMFSTHADATEGPGLEKELEAQASMGIKYTGVSEPPPPPGTRRQRQPKTIETVRRSAERMNKFGAVLKKFGMKYYIHNHAGEFDLLEDARTTQYDILLKETDPSAVTMQLDIGWAYMAGQDVLKMFKTHPGRFELWHVKDAKYKQADPKLTPTEHARASKIVTMGEGDIDYKAVFANAKKSGLKHFVIEQDTAGQGGRDALEDCRIAYDNLFKMLS
jgi:sugar phosphate isomerase/epimerase